MTSQRTIRWRYLIGAILLAITLAAIAIVPPSPRGIDAPSTAFSAVRAMDDVNIIAQSPHPTGSVENAAVRDYLSRRMSEMGLDVSTTEGQLSPRALARLNRWSGQSRAQQNFYNVIGILRGTNSEAPAILLMAHHDTVWGSPGASDDTVGIASLLEITRAVKATGPQERDLIILLTDAEELGLSGARQFFESNPLADRVGAVINFEARGGGGSANLFQTSASNGNAARLFARHVKHPSASSLSTYVYSVLPNDTDLTPALKRDYVAYNIAHIGNAAMYHSPKITPDALDKRSLQHMGAQGLDLSLALLRANSLPAPADDATFFDLFGLVTIIYAPFWGWIFLAGGGLFYALALRAQSAPRYREVISGIAAMSVYLIIGAIALLALNAVSTYGMRPEYYDRLAAIPMLEAVALTACLAMAVIIFGRKTHSPAARLGAAIPLFALGVAGQVMAPTASYFITLPLLLCGAMSWALGRDHKASWLGTLLRGLCVTLVGVVVGYMIALGHLLMLGVGADLLPVAILPATVSVLALLPLWPKISNTIAMRFASIGAVIALALALWIQLDPIATTVPLY